MGYLYKLDPAAKSVRSPVVYGCSIGISVTRFGEISQFWGNSGLGRGNFLPFWEIPKMGKIWGNLRLINFF
jgi:hypothetical protein